MTPSEKLRKSIINFTAKHADMSQEERLLASGYMISSALAYSSFQRIPDDLVSEMELVSGIKWISMQYQDAESNLLGCTEYMLMTVKQIHLKVVNEQMTVTDAIDAVSVLLTGVVMLASTTDDMAKKAAQCDAIAQSIRKVAMIELARVYAPLGEMN